MAQGTTEEEASREDKRDGRPLEPDTEGFSSGNTAAVVVGAVVFFAFLGAGIWGCVRATRYGTKHDHDVALGLLIPGALVPPLWPLMIGPLVIGAECKPPVLAAKH